MRRLRPSLPARANVRPVLAEMVGIGLIAIGLDAIYHPAALVFAGAVIVFIAQGMERDE